MKLFTMSALLGAALMVPAQAEEVTISQALAAGSLHDGTLDMVAYWLPLANGALEVTATFRDPATADEPMRVVMPMQDGDSLSFGMPGHPYQLYTFARREQAVTISVMSKPDRIATRAMTIDPAKMLPQMAAAE
ncbi:hypothetical protein [Rubellimicrobium roseum]|uniref:hypothetical protein n=1 Tax=Rubellimicrobium roseum TaxID=687525 RepID=UPI001C3F2DA0|nr:hypothetical protein [Rubellimicrobium roseum]